MKMSSAKSTVVLLVVTAISFATLWWATEWYSISAENARGFTPGDLGDALNIPLLVATLIAVFYSASAYHNSVTQMSDARVDQKNQYLNQLLSAALADYQRRVSDQTKEQQFRLALNSLTTYETEIGEESAGKRWTHYRTSNYMLKPLAYWCNWLYQYEGIATNENAHVLKAAAYRILAGMSSDAQVYLILAHDLKLETVMGQHNEYQRCVRDHVVLYRFLENYAPVELTGCREGNQGQMRVISEFLSRARWANGSESHKAFF